MLPTASPVDGELVVPTIQYINEAYPEITSVYGSKCSFNPTFSDGGGQGWISKGYYGIDQGPIVLMIENFRSGMIWDLVALPIQRRVPLDVRPVVLPGGHVTLDPSQIYSSTNRRELGVAVGFKTAMDGDLDAHHATTACVVVRR